ncbi:hypothetical protein [Streptomyces sp. G1]|uniref:hypothetical protein n=1 Tax=Streptomyces sp. G1 TaxID=361572 RepID=UPI0020306290|nr:hypothetical protein [Streptomyces sp. G1]MCM1967759.1 hypothetical protein [Streptomyces sp. G1]
MPPTLDRPRFEYRGLTVPYIALWEHERITHPRLTFVRAPGGVGRLAYVGEKSRDRDRRGALYVRENSAQGQGTPDFPRMHSVRQREAQRRLLCQVCGVSARKMHQGRTLYLMGSPEGREPIREGERSPSPPLCPPCALESASSCRQLRRGLAAAWVEKIVPWGVSGIPHHPDTLQPLVEDRVEVAYDDRRIRFTLAYYQVNELRGVTPVSLEELRALA